MPDFFLVLLVVGYFCLTTYDIIIQLRWQRLKRQLVQRRVVRRKRRAEEVRAAAAAAAGGRNRITPWEAAVVEGAVARDSSDSSGDDDADWQDGAAGACAYNLRAHWSDTPHPSSLLEQIGEDCAFR